MAHGAMCADCRAALVQCSVLEGHRGHRGLCGPACGMAAPPEEWPYVTFFL